MTRALVIWVLRKLGLSHALELDHSPSRSCVGACPCKSCTRSREALS